MKSLAKSIQVLAGQLVRLKEVPILDQLHSTIREFLNLMEEVVIFIRRWLESWMCMYPFIFIWVDLGLMNWLQSSTSVLTLKWRKQLR